MFNEENAELIKQFLMHQDISGWFKNNEGGFYLQEFQKLFANCCGTKYTFAVSSGSAAIYLALKALGIGRSYCVAVPTYTHVGTVAPVVLAGAAPLFVDCDQYGNVTVETIKKAVIEEHACPNAILVVHQLGLPCDVDAIHNHYPQIPIIEDASHALGSTYKNKPVGTLGNIAAFSVGGGRTKTIGTGEGGMVVTDDVVLAERVKNMRNHGDRNADKDYFCMNFRMSELNALLGYLQMRYVADALEYQETNAQYIIENLPGYLEVPETPKDVHTVHYLIGCHFNSQIAKMTRNEFLSEMADYQIGPREYVGGGYSKLISDVQFYSRWKHGRRFINSEKLRDESVWIDFHRPPRTREEIDKLIERLHSL